jgi:16S rRNA processing protein RimM
MSKSLTDTPWRPPTIVVGRVGRPHGLDGATYLDGHGGAVPVQRGLEVTVGGRPATIADRRGSDSHPIVRFDLSTDRNAAEALRGQDVEVPASALPPPQPDADDYLHIDLIGCRVTAGERELGTVADVLVYPANDVLEVRSGDGLDPVLVPFAADVVETVDLAGRLIVIRSDFL